MKYSARQAQAHKIKSGCIVVGVFAQRKLSQSASRLNDASQGHLARVMRAGDLNGDPGKCLLLHDVPGIPAARVLLVGCGEQGDLSRTALRKALGAAAKTLCNSPVHDAAFCVAELATDDAHWILRQSVESLAASLYQFDTTKSEKLPRRKLKQVTFLLDGEMKTAAANAALDEGQAIGEGVNLARELSNLPGNVCTPGYLASAARKLANRHDTLKATILSEKQMEKLGMGALLSVSRGSREPAKLIPLKYSGAASKQRPIVLVGKGLTFDAGGISLKPAAAMDEMKYDMCGGASVLGTLAACAALKLPLNVVGVVPSSENLPDGNANKPGDIVTSMAGLTIEVLNTDAEGRLILCDALSYSARFNPDVVIDIATLTGACVIALGAHASGLMSNHPPLSEALLKAGENSGDRAWPLPLWDDYQGQLDSNFADLANIGGRQAGSITAGCFLSRFTADFHWAHLDIAGTAWTQGKQKGATGRPVPLLVQYLLDRASE